MMRAFVRYVVRRHLPLVAIAAVGTALFLLSFVWLGVDAFYVWALLLVVGWVLLALRDGPEGYDPVLERVEARERAVRVAAIMRGEL